MSHSRHGAMMWSSGSESAEREFEPNLIIAFAGRSVCDRIAARLESDLSVVFCDQRPRESGPEQVGTLVDRPPTDRGKHEVARKLFAQIADHTVDRARLPGLLREPVSSSSWPTSAV